MIVGCSDRQHHTYVPEEQKSPDREVLAALGKTRSQANVFYSGHSLLDRPLPDFVQDIAASLATSAEWNRQYIVGSSIQRRTRGDDLARPTWQGYREGYNREGEGMDVVAELRTPRTIDGLYDVLVITEQHTLLDVVLEADSVRSLRHFHEQFIAGNPHGQSFFYEPWFSVADKSEPQRWIAYERSASQIWQCVATRINTSLAAEGRTDRIISLPAGLALAELIERATRTPGLPAISRANVRETVDAIIADDVHLTELGIYFMSLVTYSSVYQRPVAGAWHPDSVTKAEAATLQDFAWRFVSDYYSNYRPLPLERCTEALLSGERLATLWYYVREAQWRKSVGPAHSYVRYLRRLMRSKQILRSESDDNPFYFDPSSDRDYWHPHLQ
jgi:hypothetical protein